MTDAQAPSCIVSIIVPMRNEEEYLTDFLASLMATTYPIDKVKVIILDGMSNDHSAQIIREFQQAQPDLNITVLANQKVTIPSALNLGINSAESDVILRMDCHAEYDVDYVSNSVKHLFLQPDAVGVGGVITPVGKTDTGKAITLALSSRLGTGGASYRHTQEVVESETIWCGCWRKEDAVRAGLFNEAQEANEDFAFNQRLQRFGKLYTCPDVMAKQYVRESYSGLFAQYMRYGFWKAVAVKINPNDLKLRQMAPLVFFGSVLVSICFLAVSAVPFTVLTGGYLSAVLLAPIGATRGNLRLSLKVSMALVTMHGAWFLGFIKGLFKPLSAALIKTQ